MSSKGSPGNALYKNCVPAATRPAACPVGGVPTQKPANHLIFLFALVHQRHLLGGLSERLVLIQHHVFSIEVVRWRTRFRLGADNVIRARLFQQPPPATSAGTVRRVTARCCNKKFSIEVVKMDFL